MPIWILRIVALVFVSSLFLIAADLRVDHVTVAGADLKPMRDRLAAIGILTEYGGPHSNGATQMALASFPDGSYLELIALQDKPDAKAAAAHYWSKQIRGNAGPSAWAVRSSDVSAEAARLRTAGITVTAPSSSGRTRPDGTRLAWETAQVGAEPNGTFFPFLIHDLTPREARAFPDGKASVKDFPGVKRVVIAVRDLKAAAVRYRRAFGLPPAAEQDDAAFGAHLASFDGTPVVLAAPIDAGSWIARRIEMFGEGPCAFVLGVRTGGAYASASKTRWFGTNIAWFDTAKLGWHLGFEQ